MKMGMMCYDDFEWSQLTVPTISAIRQPMKEMGRKAVELLLKKIGDPDARCENIILKSEFILRESC